MCSSTTNQSKGAQQRCALDELARINGEGSRGVLGIWSSWFAVMVVGFGSRRGWKLRDLFDFVSVSCMGEH